MKTLILYTSRYGCTADCAQQLKAQLSGPVSLADIDRISQNPVDLKDFDTIILGSSIYIGAVPKKMKAFCRANEALLSGKRTGIFLCCAFEEKLDEYLSSNIPPSLWKNAVTASFGGEARLEKMKTLDKLIMKAAMKESVKPLEISPEKIEYFSKAIQAG